jgi:hypothetical protein
LKLGGCLAIYLKTLLKPSPPPLDQNFEIFKIQLKFGQIRQTFLFSFLFSLTHLKIDQVTQVLASHLLFFPLHCSSSILAPLSFLLGGFGEARGKSLEDLHSTLSHSPPLP